MAGALAAADEVKLLVAYFKAVAKHWWAIVTGLVLTLLDGVERLFGIWYLPPLWAKLATGIAGLVVAQYLAYRDLARHAPDSSAEFKEDVRQALRSAELKWALLDKPEATVTPQMLCKQVDEFRAVLEELYSRCPPPTNSQPLRDAIEKLHATKAHRVGNLIGSQQEADRICEQMKAALADVGAMLN